MSREAVRNICIVIALVLVVAVPAGGGALAGLVLLVLRVLMVAAFLYFGYVMWRENKHKTAWLPDRQRAILYAAATLLGVLLLGVPGTGKSAFCNALGNETGRPTLTLDLGVLMGSLVGANEQNIRQAL